MSKPLLKRAALANFYVLFFCGTALILLSCTSKPSQANDATAVQTHEAPMDSMFIKTSLNVYKDFEKQDFAHMQQYFDRYVKKSLTEKQVAQIWKNLTEQAGKLEEHGKVSLVKQNNLTLVYVECYFEKMLLYLKLVFREDENIVTGLFFLPAKT